MESKRDYNEGASRCTDPKLDRILLEPYQSDLEKMYMEKHFRVLESNMWFPHEVSFDEDKPEKLNPVQLRIVKMPHLFFAVSEAIVKDDVLQMLKERITWKPVHAFYDYQVMNERVHETTYNRAFNSLFPAEERDGAIKMLDDSPSINAKREWMKECSETPNMSTRELLLRAACSEGILFCSSFATIHGINKLGLLPGICLANQFISRDETVHMLNHLFVLYYLCEQMPREDIERIVTKAVEIESMFADEVFEGVDSGIGITPRKMHLYIRFVADEMLDLIDEEPLFGVANPFEWMTTLHSDIKENFHERKTGQYSMFKRPHMSAKKISEHIKSDEPLEWE